jgi:hypothetical protein
MGLKKANFTVRRTSKVTAGDHVLEETDQCSTAKSSEHSRHRKRQVKQCHVFVLESLKLTAS